VDGAIALFVRPADPEERAGFRLVFKDAHIREQIDFVPVDGDFSNLARILVEQQERIVAALLFDTVDEPEMAAALPALGALKCQLPSPPWISRKNAGFFEHGRHGGNHEPPAVSPPPPLRYERHRFDAPVRVPGEAGPVILRPIRPEVIRHQQQAGQRDVRIPGRPVQTDPGSPVGLLYLHDPEY